ncbi:MAG: M20/M25/M40 family metallo-hydrolase [Acidobacteria bacterium]|nr:M20/M25/M40 family metallo-hydrolase [Acidobacteriota bacterium]
MPQQPTGPSIKAEIPSPGSYDACRGSILALLVVGLTLSAFGQQTPGDPAGEALTYLQEYLKIDTSNPPGRTLEAAQFLKSILDREGISTRLFESVPQEKANLLARLPATVANPRKPLLLLNHMDVVPADRKQWPVDPFAATIRDGFLYSRGALDMKAHGIVHLMTLLQLKRAQTPRDRDIVFLAVSDEESGGVAGTRWMVENHFSELDPEFVIDEGGWGFQSLLASGRTVFGISVAEKQVLWLGLNTRGPSGHGSQPVSENANDHLVGALQRLRDHTWPSTEHPVLKEMTARIGTFADNPFTRAIQRPTCSLTSLRSGVGEPAKVNVIPSQASATLDCRLMPGQSSAAFLESLHETLKDSAVNVEALYDSGAKQSTPFSTGLFEAMERTLQKHFPETIVTPLLVPYGTDSAAFRERGVYAYGFLPIVVTPEILASLHSDNERLPLDGFRKALEVFFEIAREAVRPH